MTKKDRIVVTAGDYDLLSAEDLRFLKKCRSKGDWLIVGLHSDMMVHLTTNTLHNNYDDRQELLLGLKFVDEVQRFNDSNGNYCQLLKNVKLFYPQADITFVSKHDMHNYPETKIRGITFEVIS
jgi:bifunctional ADP-heptose synthase (sugar kinase/adenylyltransferase)